MILVYVAGPYTADTPEGVEENCRRAREVGAELAKCGPNIFPVIPHQTGRDIEHIGDYRFWIEGTVELMRRCDVVYVCPGWEGSRGTLGEIAEAERLGIPVIRNDLTLFAAGAKGRLFGCRR
jgi:hypothetical protein